MQPFVKDHLASHRIVANDQRLGIVEQDLARHPAKVPEGPPLGPRTTLVVAHAETRPTKPEREYPSVATNR